MPIKKIRNKFTREERGMKFTYKDFIKSEWWTKQKEDWYSRHKKRCAICKKDKGVHLHHKRYPKDGRYLNLNDNAFVALCGGCHKQYHDKHGVSQYMQTTSNRFVRGKRDEVYLKGKLQNKNMSWYRTGKKYTDKKLQKRLRKLSRTVESGRLSGMKLAMAKNQAYVYDLKRRPTKTEKIVGDWMYENGINFKFQKGFVLPFQ